MPRLNLFGDALDAPLSIDLDDRLWPFSALHIADFDDDGTTALGKSRRSNPINSDTFCTIGSELLQP